MKKFVGQLLYQYWVFTIKLRKIFNVIVRIKWLLQRNTIDTLDILKLYPPKPIFPPSLGSIQNESAFDKDGIYFK